MYLCVIVSTFLFLSRSFSWAHLIFVYVYSLQLKEEIKAPVSLTQNLLWQSLEYIKELA